jgi:acyl-CoA thioesterase FadM
LCHNRGFLFNPKEVPISNELTDRKDERTVFAKGESVQVCFDYEQNRSIPVSAALKDQLLEYQWNFV